MRIIKDDRSGEVIGVIQLQFPDDPGMLDLPLERWQHKPEPNEAYVEWVATTRTGQGIGTSLLRWANAFAFENGFKKITLMVMQKNVRGIRLYRRKGYKIKVHKNGGIALCYIIYCFMGCYCQLL